MTDTSLIAAESIRDSAENLRDLIAHRIQLSKSGRTCDEIEVELGMKHQTASARIRELRGDERVYDSGERRATRSGRPAIVWKVT